VSAKIGQPVSSIAWRLAEMRRRLGITQAEVAARMGVTKGCSAIEHAKPGATELHRRCHRVGPEAVRPPRPRGVGLVRVRTRITQPVPVRRAAAEVAALFSGLGGHRGPYPDPGPCDLPLGRLARREHGLLVILGVPVDPSAHLRHPQRDSVVLEQRRHRRVLVTVERPLVLPDHDRVPPPIRVRQRRHQGRGLRSPRPRQRPALPRIEELRHDHPVPRRQHDGLLQLPGP
jgi:hypothetical protein